MALLNKKRKKWLITIILLILTIGFWVIVSIFNWKKIPIQENFISMIKVIFNFIKWILGFVFGGYVYKKYMEGKQ